MASIEYVAGDIRNAEEVAAAVEGVDSVCHLRSSMGRSFFTPSRSSCWKSA